MDNNTVTAEIVSNEYDYSNLLPTFEAVSYLANYCYEMYKKLLELVEQDEKKNKQLKEEYTDYMYKRSFSQEYEIYIRQKSYTNNITCNDYESFLSAEKGGNLNNIDSMDIKLCMNFKRGRQGKIDEHENKFLIVFKPYDIRFTRTSNHNDPSMNKIEEQINNILSQFPVANSIFCNKQNN